MRRTLFLLRHAKSSWDDPTLADVDRPLAQRGRRACRLVAGHLRRERVVPGLVLCSPAARTRETLERIAPAFERRPEVRTEDALYGAGYADLLARLHEVRDTVDSVLVIGHDPAIRDLALRLTGDAKPLEGKFPTAALATLEFTGGWGALAPGTAELVAFVTPKDLETSRP